MLLIEKRNGGIKVRACDDGSKQRKQENYRKEDNASPTYPNEGIMITSAIKAHEERDVSIIDILQSFLHAHTDELIYMLLRGPLSELMVMVDPVLYKDFITYYLKGRALMYVRVNKALYGMLKSALQFYLKFSSDI